MSIAKGPCSEPRCPLVTTGFVHRAVIEDLPDLSDHQVYACGAPVMVESAQRDFTQHHALPADEFYADSFTSAADLAHPV